MDSDFVLILLGSTAIILLLALVVKAVLWTGKDARQRGFQPVWLLQLLVVIEFPWPWLMYYLITRSIDRHPRRPPARSAVGPDALA